MKKIKIYLCSAFTLSLMLFLPCYGQTPKHQNNAPAPATVKEHRLCSIFNVRLGMSEDEVEDILGRPAYKSDRNTVWHYRNLVKASRDKSDPQIKFVDGKVNSVIGSALNINGLTVLANNDNERQIQKALGPCQEIKRGANSRTAVYVYYQYSLEIITIDTRIAVIKLQAK